jgi:hypothetical protein
MRLDAKNRLVNVELPEATIKSLKQRAFENDTTIRVIVLDALRAAGIEVPEGQAVDFRRHKQKLQTGAQSFGPLS